MKLYSKAVDYDVCHQAHVFELNATFLSDNTLRVQARVSAATDKFELSFLRLKAAGATYEKLEGIPDMAFMDVITLRNALDQLIHDYDEVGIKS